MLLKVKAKTRRKINYFNSQTRIAYYNSQMQRHRIKGPAVIWSDSFKEWWMNGEYIRTEYVT